MNALTSDDALYTSLLIGRTGLKIFTDILGVVGDAYDLITEKVQKMYNRSRISFFYDASNQAATIKNQKELLMNAFKGLPEGRIEYTKFSDTFISLSNALNIIIKS